MDLFRDDAPFVERDVMAGIRALLNGPDEAQPSLPKAGEIEAMLREAKHAARRQMNGHLEVGEDALKKRQEQLLASGLGNILDHVGLGADVRWLLLSESFACWRWSTRASKWPTTNSRSVLSAASKKPTKHTSRRSCPRPSPTEVAWLTEDHAGVDVDAMDVVSLQALDNIIVQHSSAWEREFERAMKAMAEECWTMMLSSA